MVKRSVMLKHIFFIFFDLFKFRVKFGVLFDFNIKIMDFEDFSWGVNRKIFKMCLNIHFPTTRVGLYVCPGAIALTLDLRGGGGGGCLFATNTKNILYMVIQMQINWISHTNELKNTKKDNS